MNKLYEFECNTMSMTARQFYNYVVREFKKRTGQDFMWIDDFESWDNPIQPSYTRSAHFEEICKTLPCDFQFYLQDAYNFIMEWFDGHGYCYAVEFER